MIRTTFRSWIANSAGARDLQTHQAKSAAKAASWVQSLMRARGKIFRQRQICVDFPPRQRARSAILYQAELLSLLDVLCRSDRGALRGIKSSSIRFHKRPQLTQRERWFWVLLTRGWKDWRTALVIVQPDTVVRWHRERFRRFWARLSKNSLPPRGRPAISREIRELVRRMAIANPLWRAPEFMASYRNLVSPSQNALSLAFSKVSNDLHHKLGKCF
jgi:hypothetical protein